MFKSSLVVKTIVTTMAMIAMVSMMHNAHAVKPDKDSVVSKNFADLSRQFRNLRNAENNEELLGYLNRGKELALINRGEVPSYMEAGTPEYEEYQLGIDEFVARIDSVLEVANTGDFEAAMQAYNDNVFGSKRDFHQKFDIENAR